MNSTTTNKTDSKNAKCEACGEIVDQDAIIDGICCECYYDTGRMHYAICDDDIDLLAAEQS